ncbi:AraC family transcriptional regulator [Herbaspirillum sp. ST 5-3]|uniref:AraC family transcriptional regulator n=1 Tax=Oxalobacteraceae TaxID=75682 RepID=UPI0010A32E29|nr:AraC family transcriptional regulator [Herbaspirillum sp. ST 5-3]
MTVPAYWFEPAFHSTYARLLCVMLRKRGVETDRLLAGTGLSWPDLTDAERAIGFAQMQVLVRAAIALSGSPSLGAEIGASAPAAAHGQVGRVVVSGGNVGQAIDALARYSKLRCTMLEFRPYCDDTHCRLQVRELFDLGDLRTPILEAALMVVVRLLQTVLGQVPEEVQYKLPYPEPAWSAAYASLLRGRKRFGTVCLEIKLPRALLDAPCLTADPVAFASARRDCEQALEQILHKSDLLQQIRLRLRACAEAFPTCEAIAAERNMSSRTLIRKFKQRGTSYQDLLDEVRKERAQWLLQNTACSLAEIAERLGYFDASNFSRSFRRWFGVSPNVFRQANRSHVESASLPQLNREAGGAQA